MNIELHGFLPEHSEQLLEEIWRGIITTSAELAAESAVTIVQSSSYNRQGKNTPFIRVYSDEESDFAEAQTILASVRSLLALVRKPGQKKMIMIEWTLLSNILDLS